MQESDAHHLQTLVKKHAPENGPAQKFLDEALALTDESQKVDLNIKFQREILRRRLHRDANIFIEKRRLEDSNFAEAARLMGEIPDPRMRRDTVRDALYQLLRQDMEFQSIFTSYQDLGKYLSMGKFVVKPSVDDVM